MASHQELKILPELGINNLTAARVAVVKTAWNKAIINELEKGVIEVCAANNILIKQSITVPGAVEIPFAIKAIAQSYLTKPNEAPQAYIALGCVIKGDTPHFDFVCQSVTQGITLLNVQLNTPVIFGVLTVNTEQQAWDRLGGTHGHKGKEAAETAISMLAMLQHLQP